MKKQVKAISRSVTTGYPKIAIAELCGVLHALILEIEKIQSPKVTFLSTEQTASVETPLPCIPTKSPMGQKDGPIEVPGPREGWRDPKRRFNAGDAE